MHLGHIHEPEEQNPELALKHYGRAIEFLRSGNKPHAIEELKQTLRYDPSFLEAKTKLRDLGEEV